MSTLAFSKFARSFATNAAIAEKRILLTGGNGNIGFKLFQHFKEQYPISIIDISEPKQNILNSINSSTKDHSYHKLDLTNINSKTDLNVLDTLISNSDVIIHNAQRKPSPDSTWPQCISSIELNNTLFLRCMEKIQQNTAKKIKILYASSNHVMGGYLHNNQPIKTTSDPLPGTKFHLNDINFESDSTPYAVVKLCGEKLLKTLCLQYPNNIQAIAIRIGWNQNTEKNLPTTIRPYWLFGTPKDKYVNTGIDPKDYDEYSRKVLEYFQNMWLSNQDLCSLYECAISERFTESEYNNYIIVNGVSNNRNTRWDLENPIGYVPQSDVHSEKYWKCL